MRYAREHPDWDPDDGLPIAVFPPVVRCKCGHVQSMHYRDRKDRPLCGSAVCGCASFRPKEETS